MWTCSNSTPDKVSCASITSRSCSIWVILLWSDKWTLWFCFWAFCIQYLTLHIKEDRRSCKLQLVILMSRGQIQEIDLLKIGSAQLSVRHTSLLHSQSYRIPHQTLIIRFIMKLCLMVKNILFVERKTFIINPRHCQSYNWCNDEWSISFTWLHNVRVYKGYNDLRHKNQSSSSIK